MESTQQQFITNTGIECYIKQIEYLSKQLEETKQQLEECEKRKLVKRGSIYAYIHKETKQLMYIGSHKDTNFEDRDRTHRSDALKNISIPFYRYIFSVGMQQFKQILLKEVDYIEESELIAEEYKLQEQYNTIQKRDCFYCDTCKKHYKQIHQFVDHQINCFRGISSTSDEEQTVKPKSRRVHKPNIVQSAKAEHLFPLKNI